MTYGSSDESDFGDPDDDALLTATPAPTLVLKPESSDASKRKFASSVDETHNKKLASSGSAYPLTSPAAVTVLQRLFGLQAFRLKQEAAIARLIAGGSAVVVFPTGGGKSLCYQVPALVFPDQDKEQGIRADGYHGITLVISPLIALMKDQVDALRRRGIPAACLDSTKGREEYLETMSDMREGRLRILYCAPERLNNEAFVSNIQQVRGGIRLVAIDEAHCISEWGHSFRPDYLKVARFVKECQAERVVCLTATATPQVARDVCDAFDIDTSGLFRTTVYRPNLELRIQSTKVKDETFPKLFAFFRANPGPTIVYVTLQKQAENLADDLREQKFNARCFHAGMEVKAKTEVQNAFMASDKLIIVATIAFGMGIDKANIRNVVHFDIPASIEGYSQEIGRAGRDGLTSQCLLFLSGEDLPLRESFCRGDMPSRESVHALLSEIFSAENAQTPVGRTLEFTHYSQSRDHDIRSSTLSIVYASLELRFRLLRAMTPRYTTYKFQARRGWEQFVDKSPLPVVKAIKNHAKKAVTWYDIDVNVAAMSGGMSRYDVVQKLEDWNSSGLIELKTTGVLNVYRVESQLPASSAELEALTTDLYRELKAREQKDLDRIHQVTDLLTAPKCLNLSLAHHFGSEPPKGRQECGHCQWCQTHEQVVLHKLEPPGFDSTSFNRILEVCPDRDDARFLARIAFGITSPRTTKQKFSWFSTQGVFGTMRDHDFEHLVRSFASVCSNANQRGSTESSRSRHTDTSKPRVLVRSNSAKKTSLYRGRGRGRGRGYG